MSEPTDGHRVALRIAEGLTVEQVYLELLKDGWKVERIQRAYEEKDEAAEKGDVQQRAVGTLVVLAALMVTAAIFSFVAANWDAVGDYGKLVLLLFLIVAFHAGGLYAADRSPASSRLSSMLHLIGSCAFGAGIFLISQSYNMQVAWSDGFMLWMLGVLAMGAALRSRAQYLLAVPLAFVALIGVPEMFYEEGLRLDTAGLSITLLTAATAACLALGWQLRKKELATKPELY